MWFEGNYTKAIKQRRAFKLDGFATLADVGFDGDYVSPYQIASKSTKGPVLIAYNWLDVPSIEENRSTLTQLGYLPGITFNNVLDRALSLARTDRSGIYVTQAFHLLPQSRSQHISQSDVDRSFEAVTIHELKGRKIVALGEAAGNACKRFGVEHVAVCHPSARGRTHDDKAA